MIPMPELTSPVASSSPHLDPFFIPLPRSGIASPDPPPPCLGLALLDSRSSPSDGAVIVCSAMADDDDDDDDDLLQPDKVDDVHYFPSAAAYYGAVDDGTSPDFEFSFDFSGSACQLDQLPCSGGHLMLSAEELFYNGKLRSSPLVPTMTTAAATASEVSPQEESDRESMVATAWANFNESLAMAVAAGEGDDVEQQHLSLVGFGIDTASPPPPPPMATTCAASASRRVQVRSLDDGLAMHMMMMSNDVKKKQQQLKRLSDNPRCISMSSADDEGGGGAASCRPKHRSCVSLSNSRCSSPSRSTGSSASTVPIIPFTFSQPLTRTGAGASAAVLADFDVVRDIDSAATSASHRYPAATNYQRKRGGGAAQPRSSSKLLDFFRLRRHHKLSIDATANPRSFFWPFSRSNSAGLPAVTSTHSLFPPATHLPRRSNSAGESKTTSSSLLPSHVRRNVAAAAAAAIHGKPQVRLQPGNGASSLAGARSSAEQNRMRRGEAASILIGTNNHCKQQEQQTRAGMPAMAAATLGPRPHVRYVPTSCRNKAAAEESSYRIGISSGTTSSSSPGRQAASRKMASAAATAGRLSPGRQGSGGGAGRSSAAGNRSGSNHHHPMAKTHHHHHLLVRPKDMLMASTTSSSSSNCRDPASTIRITPVLNVPACITPSSKSKIFNNLGNLFSKKDKGLRGGYSILPAMGPPHDSSHLLSGA